MTTTRSPLRAALRSAAFAAFLVPLGTGTIAMLHSGPAEAQAVIIGPSAPPPPPRVEPPPPPRAGYVWDPGHWRWAHGRYVWAPGHWQLVRVGHRWVPGHWVPQGPNWRWVGGHWS
jgi:hypothetical protein